MYSQSKKLDDREIELPETMYIRDIETRVFQAICLQTLAKIEGIGLLEGNLIDSLLGRELERIKGIHVEQDQKKQSVVIGANKPVSITFRWDKPGVVKP